MIPQNDATSSEILYLLIQHQRDIPRKEVCHPKNRLRRYELRVAAHPDAANGLISLRRRIRKIPALAGATWGAATWAAPLST